jgi:hypothetical protein
MPHFVSTMWLRNEAGPGLVALAYGPSELRTEVGGANVRILQETRYPFEDEIRFTIETSSPTRISLRLRRPAWARAWRLDGVDAVPQDGWLVIDRDWPQRTTFSLRFDVPVRAENYPAGEVAVMRGSLQFVQPIAYRTCELPVQSRPDWPDAELLSTDPGPVETLPLIDGERTDADFMIERPGTGLPDRPWEASPLQLQRHGMTLVPIGCAPLRRAGFRSQVRQQEHA